MRKNVPTILLNDLQLATLKVLTARAVDGVIRGEIAAEYKGNVVNALVRHGVLQTFRIKHFRRLDVNVARKPDHVKRAPKLPVAEVAAEIEAIAA